MSIARPWGDIAKAHKPGNPSNDAALFEIIPDDELPIHCAAPLERCPETAAVRATTSSGYERRPLCRGHAHVVFAEWMVGI
jgi:hypothetical protein